MKTQMVPLEWQPLWNEMEANFQLSNAEWVPTTEAMHDAMLGCVPPEAGGGGFFLVGEPWNHNGRGEAVHSCFRRRANGEFESRYMTLREFQEERQRRL